MSNGETTVTLASNFELVITNGSTSTLQTVAQRYNQLILLHGKPLASAATPTLHECTINVTSTTEELGMDNDESYTLTVGVKGANYATCAITAATFVGAMYGAETLSQLVLSNGLMPGSKGATYAIPQAPWLITDKPRFPFRGLMVDTAR
jgi:hexosaminidase